MMATKAVLDTIERMYAVLDCTPIKTIEISVRCSSLSLDVKENLRNYIAHRKIDERYNRPNT